MRHPQEVLGRAGLIAGSALGLALLVDRRGQAFGDIGALRVVGGRDRERVGERVLGLGKIALVETDLTDDGPGDALLGRIDTWGASQQQAWALCGRDAPDHLPAYRSCAARVSTTALSGCSGKVWANFSAAGVACRCAALRASGVIPSSLFCSATSAA